MDAALLGQGHLNPFLFGVGNWRLGFELLFVVQNVVVISECLSV